MFQKLSRRSLLKTTATTGAMLGLGDLGFLSRLGAVSAAEAKLNPNVVRLDPSIEPLVQLIETTPRDQLLEEVAGRIQKGLSYRELLAALLLAGVKNIEPRPSVGFKFHSVLVVNSAHLASLASPDEHRWLPIFWALDHFKGAQARDVEERGDWTMSAVDEPAVPPAHKAKAAFIEAMDNWDEEAADAAVAGLARTAGSNEIYELFVRYGMRDFRDIGHKAIYVANSWRTLNCIGWQHAEPVLRSLAYALLAHSGGNPAKRDDAADRPYRRNLELVKKSPDNWQQGKLDKSATAEMLETLRTASNDDACTQVVDLLNRGIGPQAIWDALHVASGELLMRQPAIVALHAVTTTNALHYAYQSSGDDESRRLLLLQNAAFVTMFRDAMKSRGEIKNITIDELKPENGESGEKAVDQILADVSKNPMSAARTLIGFLKEGKGDTAPAEEFMDAARVLVFLKGDDAHDYKFSSAVLEDYYHVSPQWRDVYLATNVFKLCGSADRDNKLVERTRAALKA
jgi:hypothetical protein